MQGADTIHGGRGEDILIGDYGRISWINEDGNEVARSGGGGYGDYTDGVLRSIFKVEVVYPRSTVNNFDSGDDVIYGNGARDVIFGCGGDYGECPKEDCGGQRREQSFKTFCCQRSVP